MGYMVHHAIIVTSWDENSIKTSHSMAVEIFKDLVSDIVKSKTNGYISFFVAPDGSKAGWTESNDGDVRRDKFIEWLNEQRYEDGSSNMDWAEIQYGDENGFNKIVRDDENSKLKR